MKTDRKWIQFLQDSRLQAHELVYDGQIIQVYRNQLAVEEGQFVQRDLVHHLPGVGILATNDHQQVILVKQYRPGLVQDLYEIPAGLVDIKDGHLETRLLTAQRELAEETQYQATIWQELGTYAVSPGFTDERLTLFHAQGLSLVEYPVAQDDHENVTAFLLDKEQIKAMLRSQQIIDMKTVLALNYWLSKGELS